jgi:hypothetical protein
VKRVVPRNDEPTKAMPVIFAVPATWAGGVPACTINIVIPA